METAQTVAFVGEAAASRRLGRVWMLESSRRYPLQVEEMRIGWAIATW